MSIYATVAQHDARAKYKAEVQRVIFRKFKDGEVIAWLPDAEVNPSMCMSYMHIGQHGEGQYPAATVPATAEEYGELKAELERIGYTLRVVSRLVR